MSCSLLPGTEFKPKVMEMNNWFSLFPGCMLGLVVAAVAATLEMRPHKAGAGEEEK